MTTILKMASSLPQEVSFHQVSKSKTSVKPSPPPDLTGGNHLHLTPWDLSMLSVNYIQCGLLFSGTHLAVDHIIDRLRALLSAAIHHFYPLAGCLVTKNHDDGLVISVDCDDAGGAEFTLSTAEHVTVANVLAPDLPSFIRFFFPLGTAVNHDGHFLPLPAVQVTELTDGVFLGCSMNHLVANGMSFWNFLNAWAPFCRTGCTNQSDVEELAVSRRQRPVHDRWFVDGVDPPVKFPFSHPDLFINRYSPPENLRVGVFHFTSASMARLKSVANEECKDEGITISSFQALCSLVWRSVTRARQARPEQTATCRVASNDRAKLRLPLSPDYFGNFVTVIGSAATVGDLLSNGIGWGAQRVHERVMAHGDEEIRQAMRQWKEAPVILNSCNVSPLNVSMLSSPQFGVYSCDFGWGTPAGVRNGRTFAADGMVAAFPGREGGGSVDLEVYIVAETMEKLTSDEEFMSFADSHCQVKNIAVAKQ